MGIYSPGRRRLMLALLLTSVLLLALDAQGNVVFDRGRDGFQSALDPLQSGAEVVTRPVRNAWRGITEYGELEDENQELREQLEGQRADQIMARAAIHEFDDLLALNNMDGLGAHPTLSARVLGRSPTNLRDEIEIDRGTSHGIETGMTVVAPGGLVGKVTRPGQNRSWVQVVTDLEYAVESKVISVVEPEDEESGDGPPNDAVPSERVVPTTPPTTAPAGSEPGDDGDGQDDDGDEAPETTGGPTSTQPDDEEEDSDGQDEGDDQGGENGGRGERDAGADALDNATDEETTSSFGMLEGQGSGEHVMIGLLDEATAGARFRVGDDVMTHGGDQSLAPPDLPIGTVSRVERDSSSAGPRLYVELNADTANLNYVQVVLYQPQSEADADADGDETGGGDGDGGGDRTEADATDPGDDGESAEVGG